MPRKHAIKNSFPGWRAIVATLRASRSVSGWKNCLTQNGTVRKSGVGNADASIIAIFAWFMASSREQGGNNLASERILEYGLMSAPSTLRPSKADSKGMVPAPANGSTTKSPGLEYFFTKSQAMLLLILPIYGESWCKVHSSWAQDLAHLLGAGSSSKP